MTIETTLAEIEARHSSSGGFHDSEGDRAYALSRSADDVPRLVAALKFAMGESYSHHYENGTIGKQFKLEADVAAILKGEKA